MQTDSMTPTSSTDDQTQQASVVTPPDDSVAVKDPAAQDVLCGRGGSINSHPGNEKFRTLVEKRKRVYLTARFKREKRLIASSIVNEIRANKGRFLSRDTKTGLWKDIGDEKARDKTSQALRENAPSIRAEIEEEINEQRAELYKEETKRNPPPYPPPPSGSYYAGGWYPPYYGYSHPPPPHGHPPPPGAPPHHPPPHGYPAAPPPYAPPPPGHPYDYYHGGTAPDPYRQPPPPQPHPPQPSPPSSTKNAIEQTAEYVNESIKSWTKASTSFGGGGSVDGNSTVNSKTTLSYRHEDRRKMVKFQEDKRPSRRVRPCYSPVSMMMDEGTDMEPSPMDYADNSLMTQVANHILGNFGSWDTAICGNEKNEESIPFPKSHAASSQYEQDTDMAVEWEGQEVQLVDDNKEEQRMPPPQPREQQQQPHHSIGGSIAFSSLGSCHSWLPEQVGAAASYFSGRDEMMDHSMTSGLHSLPTNSVMDNNSGRFSMNGNSLSKVFDTNLSNQDHSQRSNGGGIAQVPSWDRSFRSRSPLSLGDDDASLISKTSSKGQGALSPVQSMDDNMAWKRE